MKFMLEWFYYHYFGVTKSTRAHNESLTRSELHFLKWYKENKVQFRLLFPRDGSMYLQLAQLAPYNFFLYNYNCALWISALIIRNCRSFIYGL